MDFGEIRAYADGFARATEAGNLDLIKAYLAEDRAEAIIPVLEALPRPISGTETVLVTTLPAEDSSPMGRKDFISVIAFFGPQGEILLRSKWKEEGMGAVIRSAQIVTDNPRRSR